MEYQLFNTGDQIWTSQRDGKRAIVKLLTHDGLFWEEEDAAYFRKLSGLEKIAHTIEVFCLRCTFLLTQ